MNPHRLKWANLGRCDDFRDRLTLSIAVSRLAHVATACCRRFRSLRWCMNATQH